MSDPIRKVGGAGGMPDVGDVAGTGTGGEAFRATLEASRSISSTEASGSVGSTAELAAAVKSGTIEPSAAVEQLVARALEAPAARGLTEAGRAQLERALRGALANDPTLLALQADLGRR
ncbi:MAG: hypothetical protein K1X94_07965 [Sandaracinaceae bacterium]|nr:hypothetical protein [Sandaracinaceae bacterium]